MDQVKRRKEAFMARLQRRLRADGECLLYNGSMTDGYPCITFRWKGKIEKLKVMRVFMILKHGAPLPVGYDVGHLPECPSRACVRHIELEHHYVNALTDPKGNHFPSESENPPSVGHRQS